MTLSRVLVVKNAWKRCRSKRGGLTGEFVLVQFRDAAHDEAAGDVVRLLP